MKEYIKESNKRILKEWKEWYLFKTIPITIVTKLNPNIQIYNIISIIEKTLKNKKYASFIEGIYIGNFNELKKRNIQAMFHDNVVYVSDFQDSPNITEKQIAKDIIHEMGHSIEQAFDFEIYGDKELLYEFSGKRKRLYDLLSFNDPITKNFLQSNEFLSNVEYSPVIDDFLYNKIGYQKLTSIISSLFLSAYCVTSISEYFANGFEEYITGNYNTIKAICPVLYNRLELINNLIKEI